MGVFNVLFISFFISVSAMEECNWTPNECNATDLDQHLSSLRLCLDSRTDPETHDGIEVIDDMYPCFLKNKTQYCDIVDPQVFGEFANSTVHLIKYYGMKHLRAGDDDWECFNSLDYNKWQTCNSLLMLFAKHYWDGKILDPSPYANCVQDLMTMEEKEKCQYPILKKIGEIIPTRIEPLQISEMKKCPQRYEEVEPEQEVIYKPQYTKAEQDIIQQYTRLGSSLIRSSFINQPPNENGFYDESGPDVNGFYDESDPNVNGFYDESGPNINGFYHESGTYLRNPYDRDLGERESSSCQCEPGPEVPTPEPYLFEFLESISDPNIHNDITMNEDLDHNNNLLKKSNLGQKMTVHQFTEDAKQIKDGKKNDYEFRHHQNKTTSWNDRPLDKQYCVKNTLFPCLLLIEHLGSRCKLDDARINKKMTELEKQEKNRYISDLLLRCSNAMETNCEDNDIDNYTYKRRIECPYF